MLNHRHDNAEFRFNTTGLVIGPSRKQRRFASVFFYLPQKKPKHVKIRRNPYLSDSTELPLLATLEIRTNKGWKSLLDWLRNRYGKVQSMGTEDEDVSPMYM